MAKLYANVPNIVGFVVKADSEGVQGPFDYGRTQADGANLIARAVKPFGGVVFWRCFVYNCQQDWRDKVTDRARSGYDNFHPLDGKFDDNVILQIKNGPQDFQVREPVHTLFGTMDHTHEMIELQIVQEYTGGSVHTCFLIPEFKEVLDFNTYAKGKDNTVADVVCGRAYGDYEYAGICAVANATSVETWCGHDLACANLYGYGRLCFDTDATAEEITRDFILQTYSAHPTVVDNLSHILLNSWLTYEKYNAPLGLGWLCNNTMHYGPGPDIYEYDRWGTYHRANRYAIGVDRTSRGTGYVLAYNEPNRSMYDNLETCPENLKLFFYRLRYDTILNSSKTLLQHIYDTHFEGVEDVEVFVQKWDELKGLVPDDVFARVQAKFRQQLEHSKEWRDVINTYFFRRTGIGDAHGRLIYD
jgi:alpha-glucuronidase